MALSFLGLGGDILTSPDGFRWLNWTAPLFAVRWGDSNSTCVVIGGGAGSPAVARATDGHTFTSSTVANPYPAESPLLESIGINDNFGVAVGRRNSSTPGDQAELWVSIDDGLNWTDVTLPSFLAGVGFLQFGNVFCSNGLTIVYGYYGTGSFIPPYTQFAMTTADGSTWVASIAPTKFIQTIRKIASQYYALAFDDDGTAYLAKSTDAINWTYKAQPLDNSNTFYNIGASDSLVALVGSTAASLGFIETSTDGGNSWLQPTIDASIEEVDAIVFNGAVWAATGFTTPDFPNVAITSIDNGSTWVLGNEIGAFGCDEIILYDVTITTAGYNLFLFDDCCHLWASFDLGLSWSQSFESNATLGDAYTDASMAIADGDYTTMVHYDLDYAGNQQGVIALSKSTGRTGTFSFLNPDPTNNPIGGGNYIEWQSGAITASAKTMILMPTYTSGGNTGSIRITNDGGATWTDTAVSLGARQWQFACIAKGGQIMYAMSVHSPGVSKSIDGGVTWADLGTSPNILADMGEGGGRIRCSDNGSIVIAAFNRHGTGSANSFSISTDAGATWSSPVSLSATSNTIDAALSSDGHVMMVVDSDAPFAPNIVRYSTNSGITWNSHDFTGTLPAGTTSVAVCNISPDGLVILAGFNASVGYVAGVSLDSGATWNIHAFGSNFPLFTLVTAFVTPPPPCNPYAPCPPHPPFVTPKGGYIIERFDNRIWPTVENVWAVDCGFALARPTPAADLTIEPI